MKGRVEGVNESMLAARERLKERLGQSIRVGGDGGARLKKKVGVHKSTMGDDRKLQSTIRRMGLSQISLVDEVAMLKDDGKALVFSYPKISAAVNANTFIVSGTPEEKKIDDSLSVRELDHTTFKKFAAEWQKLQDFSGVTDMITDEIKDDDDDVPHLVCENFESVADDAATSAT